MNSSITLILLWLCTISIAQNEEKLKTGGNVGKYIDTRDNQSYGYILLGNQYWMTENLNYNCKGSFGFSSDITEIPNRGRLYNINAAQNACPNGWHLPSNSEWEMLAKFLNKKYGPFEHKDGDWYGLGVLLKQLDYWDEKNKRFVGFNAVPTGFLQFTNDGQLKYVITDASAYWWSAGRINSDSNWIRSLLKGDDRLFLETGHFMNAYSVRCVK